MKTTLDHSGIHREYGLEISYHCHIGDRDDGNFKTREIYDATIIDEDELNQFLHEKGVTQSLFTDPLDIAIELQRAGYLSLTNR